MTAWSTTGDVNYPDKMVSHIKMTSDHPGSLNLHPPLPNVSAAFNLPLMSITTIILLQ